MVLSASRPTLTSLFEICTDSRDKVYKGTKYPRFSSPKFLDSQVINKVVDIVENMGSIADAAPKGGLSLVMQNPYLCGVASVSANV